MNRSTIRLVEENFEDKVNGSDFEQNFTQFDISKEESIDSLWWEVCLKTFFHTVILLVALTGNLLIVTTLIIDRTIRTPLNFFVAILSAADLVLNPCILWILLSNSITRTSYSLGVLLCKMGSFSESKL
ncbi:hypothetical protein NPIL_232891 [Nephila pilipes]|uniref:G-protein coupled receptors family 1 profile domain-containing protein n=1 Tax=Nephila pilipes TaxID=299642 RepID=A0A8X6UAU6_NEPPI|nr:hypothetical protein NPIL_232891 [Nephila pilipes]